ncbi:MAG: V-type ATP synthase subunit D [Chloroflexi bacterium]|jgi:V/A-type H+/Na+-transporting ATPase subunit D|nr:V-type ATP synthase subunit D [Chloroflexota bacterium]
MAEKIKLTRPELKRQRDALTRFERYLPMLKLKQQQLQMTMRQIERERQKAVKAEAEARRKFGSYKAVMNDMAGINVADLADFKEIKTSSSNVAGVAIPVFESVVFPDAHYSLFGTPAWVDRALADLREANKRRARLDILQRQTDLLQKELTKIVQRVNLFEKVKIPESRENIRRIRIQLGDEMTSAVGRAKIAKNKLDEAEGQAG